MMKIKKRPIALTIAGSDSGGGAGIQADLKTFAALGVHGTSVITCLTAQNPRRVLSVTPCPPSMIRQQIQAVLEELRPTAIKTGMLYSANIINAMVEILSSEIRPSMRSKNKPPIALVIDPLMVSTSGAVLLKPSAIKLMVKQLLPLATLITPNLAEASVLTGQPVKSVEDMRRAAKVLHDQFGCAALVKGGHLTGVREAIDILQDGKNEWLLSAPFVPDMRTHGTGCTYSAAITAALASGKNLFQSVETGKHFISNAIANSYHAGNHFALGL